MAIQARTAGTNFWSYQALLRETGQTQEDNMPHTPYTLLDHLRRTHGKEEAEQIIREMLEKRRRD